MMLTTKIIEAAEHCARTLIRALNGDLEPHRLPDTGVNAAEYSYRQRAAHLLYMCAEVKRFVEEATPVGYIAAAESLTYSATSAVWREYMVKREKAMRWLGFVQGALWAQNQATIDELKRMNMPDGPH